jgi:hypothetical protein
MANIVVLDLADKEGGTPVQKTVDTLKQKFPQRTGIKKVFCGQGNVVEKFDLFDLLAGFNGNGAMSAAQLTRVQQSCRQANKIFLCIHGKHNDTESGFASLTLGGAMTNLTTWQQLANFIILLLPERFEPFNLALIMCYGARTEHFRLNQQGDLPADEIKSSFAYKFFSKLCVTRKVRMTARTGAVQMDPSTGHSMVESEESVNARADQEDFLRAREEEAVFDNIKDLKARMTTKAGGASEESAQRWMALEARYKATPDAAANTDEERIIKTYQQAVRRKKEYQAIMDGNPDKTKFGKIVYTYSDNVLIIRCKYPEPGVNLYSGPLLAVA